MIKKLNDLSKEEKILLIQAIANGQVDKDCLNDDTMICIEEQDMFLGLMIAGSQVDEDSSLKVICIGEARKVKEALFNRIRT